MPNQNLDDMLLNALQGVPVPPPVPQPPTPDIEFSQDMLLRYANGVPVRTDLTTHQAQTQAQTQAMPTTLEQVSIQALAQENMQMQASVPSYIWNSTSIPFDDPGDAIVQNQPQWPIGTIIKWDISNKNIKLHIQARGYALSNPLIKIHAYDIYGKITEIQRFGEVEKFVEIHYETSHFVKANPFEVQLFNQALADLRQCTEYPPIGKVVKYIGKESSIKNRGVVIGHSKDNKILLKWVTGSSSGGVINISFDVFQIAKKQDGSFTPNMPDYHNCESCNSLRLLENLKIRNQKKYCDDTCARNDGQDYCRNCGDWRNASNLLNTTDGLTCSNCYESNYRECNDCGRHCNINDLQRNFGGPLQCGHCRRYGTQLIKPYDYKPSSIYSKMVYENTRYLGIELEIEIDSDKERQPMAEKITTWLKQQKGGRTDGKSLSKLVYIKNDGSLENGLEIVFHPFTLKALHKNFPIKSFLEFLNEHNAGISSRCGMHVHVSKDKVSRESLLIGKWFFYKCSSFLMKFSDRKEFKYCQFEPWEPKSDPYNQEYGRRTAFNVAGSPNTLEVRIFQATLDYTKFLANLQFADCFVAYIQNRSIVFLKNHTQWQVWEDFIDFSKRDGRYQVMSSYILREGIV